MHQTSACLSGARPAHLDLHHVLRARAPLCISRAPVFASPHFVIAVGFDARTIRGVGNAQLEGHTRYYSVQSIVLLFFTLFA